MNNKRILKILEFINPSDKVVDVGCDHAYLSKHLANRNQASTSCDIVENIIKKRKEENYSNLIKYFISDGLKSVPKEEYDLPVISGVGSYTALKIIKESNEQFNKCIICSNGKYKELRLGMLDLGYVVEKECVVKEKKHFYNIIVFKKGKIKYSEKEIYIGKNHTDLEMLNEKNVFLKNKYEQLLKIVPLSEQEEIKKELKYL